MPIGLELGLVAAVAWGWTDVSAALAGRRLGSLPVAAVVQATSVIAVLAVAIVRGSGMPTRPEDIVLAALAGAVAALAYVSFFTALRIGPVSVVSPIVAAYGGLTVVLAVIFRGETLAPLQALGAAVATAGVVMTGLVADGGWRSTRIVGPGVLFGLIATVSFAVLTVAIAGPIRSSGWLPILIVSRIANAATVWAILAVVVVVRPRIAAPLVRPRDAASGRQALTIAAAIAVGAGLLDVGGFIAYAIGLENAPTWIIGLVSSFGPVVSVLVAVLVWHERPRRSQWLGLAMIALGVVAVALP
jgi:drug/metabolite transporter (DMT)-like permease